VDLDELTRRTATLTASRERLGHEKDTLTKRSAELATENRLRRRLAGFAERVTASLDELDFEGRQRLLRLIVERVNVTGWRVEIHLKIPLTDEQPPDNDRPNDGPPGDRPPGDRPPGDRPRGPGPEPGRPVSSDVRLRSLRGTNVDSWPVRVNRSRSRSMPGTARKAAHGKPVARRGRKARGLGPRDSPATSLSSNELPRMEANPMGGTQ